MYTKLGSAIVAVAIVGLGGVSHARSAKSESLKAHLRTVCASDSWHPLNKFLYVEADCPSGQIALGGGTPDFPGDVFDGILIGTSGPVLNSNGQPVGWEYGSIRTQSGLDDLQFQSIVVTVCVECAQ